MQQVFITAWREARLIPFHQHLSLAAPIGCRASFRFFPGWLKADGTAPGLFLLALAPAQHLVQGAAAERPRSAQSSFLPLAQRSPSTGTAGDTSTTSAPAPAVERAVAWTTDGTCGYLMQ